VGDSGSQDGPSPPELPPLDLQVPKTTQWCLDAAKTLCDYIWDTYGRFPAKVDAMQMSIWFQAHHLETNFYDRYYQAGAYHQRIAEHMDTWHAGAVTGSQREHEVVAAR
jgi:hypothetical protein